MRTIALIVYPNKDIFTIGEVREPREPMHSGYIHEEEKIMKDHREQVRAYNEAVKSATKCDQEVAAQVLNEQHPNWEKELGENGDKPKHYEVKNILVRELVYGRREFFTVGEEIECVNSAPLPGNSIGPDLEEKKRYTVVSIVLDSEGNQHLDVGLESSLNYVTSYETGGDLPDGNKIHWCHPTRFKRVNK